MLTYAGIIIVVPVALLIGFWSIFFSGGVFDSPKQRRRRRIRLIVMAVLFSLVIFVISRGII